MDGTGVDGHGHDYGRDFEQGYGNDFGNDFEHDRPRADLAIHGTILTHGVETYGTVVVRDGRIASVASDSNGPGANGRAPIDAVETIQLRNDEILIPGIVDTHVHINEPGRTAWEGFACATRAAAAGGMTTILDMRPPFTGASIQAFEFPLSPPLNLPAPGRCQHLYVRFLFCRHLCLC